MHIARNLLVSPCTRERINIRIMFQIFPGTEWTWSILFTFPKAWQKRLTLVIYLMYFSELFLTRPIITTSCLSHGLTRKYGTRLYSETCLSSSTSRWDRLPHLVPFPLLVDPHSRLIGRISTSPDLWWCLLPQVCCTLVSHCKSSKDGPMMRTTWQVIIIIMIPQSCVDS